MNILDNVLSWRDGKNMSPHAQTRLLMSPLYRLLLFTITLHFTFFVLLKEAMLLQYCLSSLQVGTFLPKKRDKAWQIAFHSMPEESVHKLKRRTLDR